MFMRGRRSPKNLQSDIPNRGAPSPVSSVGGFCLEKEFGEERRWVNWKYVRKDDKLTKIPVGLNRKAAKSNDSTTWMTLKQARDVAPDFLGLMATPDKQTLLVDFDNCINEEGHINSEAVDDFVMLAKTYTELSPSGKGLHCFFRLSAPLDLIANKHAPTPTQKIECYTHGRFFTVTNKPFGDPKAVRTISKEDALKLLALLGYPWDKDSADEKAVVGLPSSALSLSDAEVLDHMFSSKNGEKIRSLYDGDTSAYAKDDSSADMALLNHFAFWTGKDAEQMQRLWLASPLGQRKKTQGRTDYRLRTIESAIRLCKEVYAPVKQPEIDNGSPSPQKLELQTHLAGKKVIYTQNTENISRILRQHASFKGRFRFDGFKRTYEIYADSQWRQFGDNDAITIQCEIQTLFPPFQTVTKTMVLDAIMMVMKENEYDSAVTYLKSLTWDKIPRLDSWLSSVYGAPKDEYHKRVGSNWLKGLVKRLVEPGCKFDYVLVLEGPQGTKKSTSLFILGANWHVETTMTTDNKDFFMQFAGKAIIEFSEGETLSRTEVKRLKAIITMQSDKYRPPYERSSQDFPRRCVFAMTTNESEYLKDDTGNRRWLPVTLVFPEADVEWLEKNREQLLAEAYHRVVPLKETVYELPKEETLAAQQARKIKDPNTDLVADWYWHELKDTDREKGITITQVHKIINGGFIHKALNKFEEMAIASILKDGLKLEKRREMVSGVRATRWYYTGTEPVVDKDVISIMDSLENF